MSFFGASDEARTRYLHLGKVALYQMSYTRDNKRDDTRYHPFCQHKIQSFSKKLFWGGWLFLPILPAGGIEGGGPAIPLVGHLLVGVQLQGLVRVEGLGQQVAIAVVGGHNEP